MNKTYIRLLISNVFLLLIIMLNNILDFFNSYSIILFLLLFLIFNFYYIGFEKNKKRYQKDIIIKLIIYSLSYYVIVYLLGLFFGFTKTGYSLKIISIIMHITPIIFTVILSELIRYILVTKGFIYKSIILLVVINMVMVDATLLVNSYSYSFIYFILLVLIPSLAKNIWLVYLTFKVGYKAPIMYRFLFELPIYILPIFPAFGVYFDSLIGLLFPILLIYLINRNFKSVEKEEIIGKKEKDIIRKIIIALVLLFLLSTILLTSGIFKYYAITVGSNSMLPSIQKGDIVVVKKIDKNEIDNLKVDDVLVFNHNNIIIVHRIVKIMEVNNVKYFYTKGDNNNAEDGYPIEASSIIGTASVTIPYLGSMTVRVNEVINQK